MQKNKPTKGPWEFYRDFHDTFTHPGEHSTVDDNHLSAYLNEEDKIEVYGPNQVANAALISLAPQMFELCKELLAEIESQGEHGDAVNKRKLLEIIKEIEG